MAATSKCRSGLWFEEMAATSKCRSGLWFEEMAATSKCRSGLWFEEMAAACRCIQPKRRNHAHVQAAFAEVVAARLAVVCRVEVYLIEINRDLLLQLEKTQCAWRVAESPRSPHHLCRALVAGAKGEIDAVSLFLGVDRVAPPSLVAISAARRLFTTTKVAPCDKGGHCRLGSRKPTRTPHFNGTCAARIEGGGDPIAHSIYPNIHSTQPAQPRGDFFDRGCRCTSKVTQRMCGAVLAIERISWV